MTEWSPRISIGLSAVIVAITEEAPQVVITREGAEVAPALPFGPFDPAGDRTLELSLRRWVSEQTGFDIGYVEQLYTFGDRGREAPLEDISVERPDRVISISYLALTPSRAVLAPSRAQWRSWYEFFPWEDWRAGRPALIDNAIAPRLATWSEDASNAALRAQRWARVRHAFALEGAVWNEERALERYELLYEAGLAPEAARDRARFAGRDYDCASEPSEHIKLGQSMSSDHRRILATAIGRLRAKIKYRPVVFELAPEAFTLLHLQRLVEAISGLTLHKQNFRRLLERTGLVEGTGEIDVSAGGRPAELFRCRREVLAERPVVGVHVPTPRGE